MSALHWICALTLALVCCLSAQPVKRNADEKISTKKMIIQRLEPFREFTKKNCPDDTKIYSPTDIREDCLSSALNCTQLELNILKDECNLTEDMKDDFNVWLDLNDELDYALNITSKSSSSCSCESYPETDVQQFLNALQSLVERW